MRSPAEWFFEERVRVFPLIPGTKEPACKWTTFEATREYAAQLGHYGVALSSWLGTVDTDSPESETWAQECLPDTPLKVRTKRGVHRYFRLNKITPKFFHVHARNLTVEFRNAGQYCVGPGSKVAGHVYAADDWTWRFLDIPLFPDFVFDDRPGTPSVRKIGAEYEFPECVAAGERHDQLFRLLRQFKGLGNTFEATFEMVLLANETRCTPPLVIDQTFERWARRAWAHPDRLLDPLGVRVPLKVDLSTWGPL